MTNVTTAMVPCPSGPFAYAQHSVDRAADVLGLDADVRAILQTPRRELTVQFPVRDDDGRNPLFTGYRVQHNLARGPLLGGIRYHAQLTLDDLRALAMRATWQCALANLPFGGAAGGVVLAPEQLSTAMLERVTRRYTSEIAVLLGPERDMLMPDSGTDARVMAWAMDTMSMHRGTTMPAVATGKPRAIGGSQGDDVVARSTVAVVRVVSAAYGRDLNGARIGVLGSGCAMHAVISLLTSVGARVCEPGVAACDVLLVGGVSAALAATARASPAPIIVEVADALDPHTDAALTDAGCVVVPDVLTGLGRVIASYFEWVQSLQQVFWSEREIHAQLERVSVRAAEQAVQWAAQRSVSLRVAATALALDRVAQAIAARGIYP